MATITRSFTVTKDAQAVNGYGPGMGAAALTADTMLFKTEQDSFVTFLGMVRDVVFAGGAVATATLSSGNAAGGTQFVTATNVFTGASVGIANATVGAGTPVLCPKGTSIYCRLTTTVANTNACTTGKVTLHYRVETVTPAQQP